MRMRMLRRCEILGAEHDAVIQERDELVRIVATVIRKADSGGSARRSRSTDLPRTLTVMSLSVIELWELGVLGIWVMDVGI